MACRQPSRTKTRSRTPSICRGSSNSSCSGRATASGSGLEDQFGAPTPAFCSDVRLQPCSDYDFNDLLVAFDLEIPPPPPAPEPTSLALLAVGIAGVAAARRRRR